MTTEIFVLLLQDGISNGAIYALIAIALVLAYAVTRIVFIPQGELVTYAALTYTALQRGAFPKLTWLLLAFGVVAFALEVFAALRSRNSKSLTKSFALFVMAPVVLLAVCRIVPLDSMPMLLQMALTIAMISVLGPTIYRLAFASIAARASVLSLLIVAVAVDFVLVGLGLLVFGPEGFHAHPISGASFSIGAMAVTAQSVWVLGTTMVMMTLLYFAFNYTMAGKALRATSVNRLGAKLVGIRTSSAGRMSFALCGAIAAISGILISPVTTIYYDVGFLIGLKGLAAAIIGALISYPGAAAAALLLGVIESFSSFSASAYKEAILFALVLPFLLWRSLRTLDFEDDPED